MGYEADSETDFGDYEPTARNPGFLFTFGTIIVCCSLNFILLPILLKRHSNKLLLKDLEEKVITPASSNESKKSENPDDDSSLESLVSNASLISQFVASVIEAKSHMKRARNSLNGIHHRRNMMISMDEDMKSTMSVATSIPKSIRDEASVSGSFISSLGGSSSASRKPIQPVPDLEVPTFPIHPMGTVLDKEKAVATDVNGEFSYVRLSPPEEQHWREKVLQTIDIDDESRQLMRLFLHYATQSAVYAIFGMINVAVIGFHLGVQSANVYIVSGMLSELTSTFTYGFSSAIGTLGPQADGAGNRTLAGKYLQLSIVLYTLFSLPSLLIWSFCTDNATLWLGFDEDTANYAQLFVYPYMVWYLFGGLDACLIEFLDVMGHEKYATLVYLVNSGSATLILVATVVGGNDLVTVGIVQTGWALMLSVANFGFIVHKGWLDDYWEGLICTNAFKDQKAFRTMMMTAIPLSVAYILTYGEWEVLTIFARYMGPAEVAAWGILGYVWTALEQFVTALGSASGVRISFLLGAGMHEEARISANKAMYMGLVLALISTFFLSTIAGWIPGWLTPDSTLQYMIFQTLSLLGIGEIFMSIGLVCWNIVEGQGRVPRATLVEVVTSWFVVIPVAAILVFGCNFNLQAIVGALVIGYTVGGVWTSFIIFTTDWEAQSKVLIERNGAHALECVRMCWEKLPEDHRIAADVLGYTEVSWRNQAKTPLMMTTRWEDLSDEERTSARLLGFNRISWENSSEQKVCETDSSSDRSRYFDEDDWVKLPRKIQEAAATLGYTEFLWNEKSTPEECDFWWKDLTPAQQEAADKLGYTRATWDGDSGSKGSSEDSTPTQQEEAGKLGFYMSASDGDNSNRGSSDDLTPDQQEGAGTLDYTKAWWEDDSGSRGSSE